MESIDGRFPSFQTACTRCERPYFYKTRHHTPGYVDVVPRSATQYNTPMIKSIKHKGLKLFFETGATSGIQAMHASKLRLLLTRLNGMTVLEDMNIPGRNLHPLKGDLKGHWSVKVS
jgi:proteic killer suppression protein